MRQVLSLIVLVAIAVSSSFAQPSDWLFSVSVRGTYTTSSKVFYNPESSSPEIRSRYAPFDNIYGAGAEVRLQNVVENFFLSLNVEYLSTQVEGTQLIVLGNLPRVLPVKDGFRLIPIELGLNMFIPLGTENVRLAMGGGVGAYYGRRVYSIVDAEAHQSNSPVGIGIHVESSFDYRLLEGIAVRAEMRFRDPEVTTESAFDQTEIVYNGTTMPLSRNPFKTKINVNGLSLGLGLVVDIF